MTTGTVTMSLADIDKLRDEVKNSQAEIKKIEKERDDIKAEKRVLKITITKHPDISKVRTLLNNFAEFIGFQSSNSGRHYIGMVEDYIRQQSRTTYYYTYHEKYGVELKNNNNNQTEEYINFDDVLPDLRKKIEQEVDSELVSLRSAVRTGSEDRLTLINNHQKEIEKITTRFNKEYLELSQKYKDLQEDKDMRKTEEILKDEIIQLKALLEAEKNKKWYNKILS